MPVSGGTAVVSAVADASKLGPSLASGVKSAGSGGAVKSALTSVGKVMGLTIGAALVVGFAKSSLAAAEEAAKINTQLEHAFEPLGDVGKNAFQPVVDWANKLQFAIGINDEAIKTMSVRLVEMGRAFFKAAGPDAANMIEKLTLGLLDMSAATGKSSAMLMRSLGPSILNEPAKALALLEKLGAVTDAQAARYKALADAGDEYGASQGIINALSERYAGAAAAAATPSAKLAATFDEIQEAVGKNLIPVIERLLPLLKGIVPLVPIILKLGVAFLTLKAISFLPNLLVTVGAALQNLGPAGRVAGKGVGTAGIALEGWGFAAVGAVGALVLLDAGMQENAQIAADNAAATRSWAQALADGSVTLDQLNANMAAQAAAAPGWAQDELNAGIATAVHKSKIIELNQALTEGKTSQMNYVTAAQKLGLTQGQIRANLDAASAAFDAQRTHLNKAGNAVRNFAGMTDEALANFKQAVVDSVQVTIGDVKKFGEAFTLTTRQLQNQAHAAVKVAQQEHKDLKAIFSDKSLTEGQKAALASLPADQRHAWAEGGKAARDQITKDATKLQHLNNQTFEQITEATKGKAQQGGHTTGAALIQGMINGANGKSAALSAAISQIVSDAIAAGNRAAGIASPSKEGEKTGRWYVAGIIKGLLSGEKALVNTATKLVEKLRSILSDDKGALKDAIKKGVGAAAEEAKVALDHAQLDMARTWEKMVSTAQRHLERLVQHFRDFKNTIRAGFSEMQDLAGAIGGLFGQTDEEGNAIAVTGAMIAQTIADKVAQATQLATLLQAAAGAGLSKSLVAQFAGQGSAAIPELESLLANPELIAQLNAAAATIAEAAGQTANALGDKFFAEAVRRAADRLDRLTEALDRFIDHLRHIFETTNQFDQLGNVSVGSGGSNGGNGGGSSRIQPAVNVYVNGWVGNDQQLAVRFRDELLRIARNNGGTGL